MFFLVNPRGGGAVYAACESNLYVTRYAQND